MSGVSARFFSSFMGVALSLVVFGELPTVPPSLTHVHLKCYITANMSPLISEFDGLKVRMNELDHEPTHVHVVYQGKSVFVDLVKMEITKGALPKRQAVTLLAWCEHNKTVLMRNWKNRLKPGGIVKIPPPSWK